MPNMFMQPGLGEILRKQQEEAVNRDLLRAQAEQYRVKAQQARDPNRISGTLPSSMAGFERYQQYTPEQRKAFEGYLQTTKVNPYVAREGAIYDAATGQYVASPTLGGAFGGVKRDEMRIVAPAEAEAASMKERAVVGTRMQEESRQKAIQDLPTVEAQTAEMLSVLEDIEKSPGLSAVVGAPEPMKGRVFGYDIPGTPAADFSTLYNRLEGQKFKQAFESLKGAGQITEIEAKQATDAAATMSTAQSEAEFRKGLKEYKRVIVNALKRARLKAGRKPDSSFAPAQPSQDQGVIDYQEFFK